MASKQKNKNKELKKIAKAHTFFSVVLFILYVGLSLIYSPEFFFSDMRDKFRALANETIIVVAKVLGPPVKPVVVGTAGCSNGNPFVFLDWADDENTKTFDIDRDNLPLITDLTESHYKDSAVAADTSYSYLVTAYGPMGPGSASSDPIIVTTQKECQAPLPNPTVTVTAFASKSVSSYQGVPSTTSKRPLFSGTTNIPNAIISIFLPSSFIISAETSANINGYWSWRPPVNISAGNHTLFVSATDPLDSSRTASTKFNFRISEEKEEKDKRKKEPVLPIAPSRPIQPPKETPKENIPVDVPFDFSLTIKNEFVFQGKDLGTFIYIKKIASRFEGESADVWYRIFDKKEREVLAFSESARLHSGKEIFKNIKLPKHLKDGRYRLQVEISLKNHNVSREKFFTVLPTPIINLGGGIIMTYPELLSRLGTASFILLLCLLIWLFLLTREYWLSFHALRHITETNLQKIGLISVKKRRGVSR